MGTSGIDRTYCRAWPTRPPPPPRTLPPFRPTSRGGEVALGGGPHLPVEILESRDTIPLPHAAFCDAPMHRSVTWRLGIAGATGRPGAGGCHVPRLAATDFVLFWDHFVTFLTATWFSRCSLPNFVPFCYYSATLLLPFSKLREPGAGICPVAYAVTMLPPICHFLEGLSDCASNCDRFRTIVLPFYDQIVTLLLRF
jgi:hypothetical protein